MARMRAPHVTRPPQWVMDDGAGAPPTSASAFRNSLRDLRISGARPGAQCPVPVGRRHGREPID
jgi:hypothetical protein